MAFVPGGRFVVTGAAGKAAMLWDQASGRRLRTFGSLPRPASLLPVSTGSDAESLRALAVSKDGRLLATEAGSVVVVWDVATGQRLRVLDGRPEPPRVDPKHPLRVAVGDPLT